MSELSEFSSEIVFEGRRLLHVEHGRGIQPPIAGKWRGRAFLDHGDSHRVPAGTQRQFGHVTRESFAAARQAPLECRYATGYTHPEIGVQIVNIQVAAIVIGLVQRTTTRIDPPD